MAHSISFPHNHWSFPYTRTTEEHKNQKHELMCILQETWQCRTTPPVREDCVTNPTPDVAGLHAILPRILRLPRTLVPNTLIDMANALWQVLPTLPTKVVLPSSSPWSTFPTSQATIAVVGEW